MRITDLKSGWAVVGNDGRHVGVVKAVRQGYVHASRGARWNDLFIPASAIANVRLETVHLNLTTRDVFEMGWEERPRDLDSVPNDSETDLHRHV